MTPVRSIATAMLISPAIIIGAMAGSASAAEHAAPAKEPIPLVGGLLGGLVGGGSDEGGSGYSSDSELTAGLGLQLGLGVKIKSSHHRGDNGGGMTGSAGAIGSSTMTNCNH